MPNVSAILLAAGESTRMGRQKALLPWDGATLIEYQLVQLSAIKEVRQIVVVTGHESERIRPLAIPYERAVCVHNAAYRSGKVSSIKAGISALARDVDAILLLAVDQPRSTAITEALLRAHFEAGRPITVPSHEGHRGHPVVFAAALLPEVRLIDEQTQGIRALMLDDNRIHVVEFKDPGVLRDLNTPADLDRVIE